MGLGLNWLDVTIICILLFGILDGMRKGFIVSFFNIAGIFISLYIAKGFTVVLADFLIKYTNIFETLKNIFMKRMSGIDSITMSVLNLFNIKGNSISDSITMIFIDVACFIIIFLVSSVIINILKDFLKIKVKKTSLRYIDKFLGALIGLTVAGIFIFIFFAVVTPLVTVMPKDSSLAAAIGSSRIAKYFFLFNFVIPWLQKMNNSQGIASFIIYIKKIYI